MRKYLQILWSFIVMALVILGIGGLMYNTLRGGGWLQRFAGVAWDAGLRHPLVIAPLVALSLWIAWLTLNGKLVLGKSGRGTNFIVYLLALLGAYILYNWLTGQP